MTATSHYSEQVGVALNEFFDVGTPIVDPLWTDLTEMIKRKSAATPRHLQRELGPSEVGHPCMRKMAFGLMEIPRCNPEYDPLPSIYGVAMHTWLEGAARLDNERLGRERWLIETRVEVTAGLSGTADLYDTDSDTVIDWKNLGYTSFTAHVKDAGPTYRGQVQMYGKGFRRKGFPVKRVAIALLPRSGTLSKMHLDIMDYDEGLANTALARRDAVLSMLYDFDIENHPERYPWFPMSPSECIWCPWWNPNASSPIQCNGRATQ